MVCIQEFLRECKGSSIKIPEWINVRFVEKDHNALLSPSRCHSAFIGFGAAGHLFHKKVEEGLYRFGGCPHWGKNHYLNYERTLALYKEDFETFIADIY